MKLNVDQTKQYVYTFLNISCDFNAHDLIQENPKSAIITSLRLLLIWSFLNIHTK